ncbi:MAG: 3-phosphoshikimate 1-carboxyvinyltransferase [Chloroflexi bacterium]|nr:3-phosphoshikimate 1-carboxyvinyltransferase [Chloroflexota bacterium]
MLRKKISPCPILKGEITPPGDKSISHRAVLLNSIAQGKARLSNFSPGADCASTVACLQALGVKITQVASDPPGLEVQGVGKKGLREADDVLNAGNSATTMRLLTGLLAAQPFLSIITGDDSLRSRPMDRVIQPLRLMGARIWGRGGDSLGPLAVKGGELHGIDYVLPVASAQIKSAVLIAALFADGTTTVQEPAKSRDHTERLLQAMGVKLKMNGASLSLSSPVPALNSIDLDIPGDISSAAYWLVAAAIHPNAQVKVKNTGINPTRTGIIDVLLRMGARLRIENQRRVGDEPVADLVIESSELAGVEIGGDLVPRLIDEIPVIAVVACAARGTTVIKDAAELRVKETDRIRSLARELSKLGADVEEMPDGMVIHGRAKLHGATCSSHRDHRLAMALAVAGLIAEGQTVIEHAEAAGISYPSFWQDMTNIQAL